MEDNWRGNIRSAIESISDIEFQRKAWFGKSQKYESSFIEMINILYDDCFFEDFIHEFSSRKEDSEFYRELSSLNKLIENYDEPHSESEIIVDSAWLSIVEQAQKIIRIWEIYN